MRVCRVCLHGLPPFAVALASSVSASASDWLLPRVTARLEAARYAPAERELAWTTWIGAGAALVRAGAANAYGSADLETIVGSERRAFDANQANYHLEVGVTVRRTDVEINPFFHHVSRHVVDRTKPQAVDWNVLGLRLSRRFQGRIPGRLTVGAGHTTLASLVGYGLELTAQGEADWLRRGRVAGYTIAAARAVTAQRSAAFPRDGFVDLLFEGGARFTRDARALAVFAAFERRHDVFVERSGHRNRGLLGFRVHFASGE